MADWYTRQQGIERVAQSEVKLTKAGEKFFKMKASEITAALAGYAADPSTVNYNEWLGIASNPNLTPEHLREMYRQMKKLATSEKNDENMAKAAKTKNIGQREKVRRVLQEHPSLDDDAFKTFIMKFRTGTLHVLKNPAIKEEHLQLFFDTHVIDITGRNSYNYLSFNQLLEANNITTKLIEKWYETLKKYADWSYSDNNWYTIVRAYLDREDCPYDMLVGIASAPNDGEEGWRSHSEPYREEALTHKNAKPELKAMAYEATKNEKYLPDLVKDIFIF